MENTKTLHALDEFAKGKPKEIPRELDEYLRYVASTGDPVYQWSLVKILFRQKLVNVVLDFNETCPMLDQPVSPNLNPFNFDTLKKQLLERFEAFSGVPFTIQRIAELLTCPKKQYSRLDKYMRALEKNMWVVSTREQLARDIMLTDGLLNGQHGHTLTHSNNGCTSPDVAKRRSDQFDSEEDDDELSVTDSDVTPGVCITEGDATTDVTHAPQTLDRDVTLDIGSTSVDETAEHGEASGHVISEPTTPYTYTEPSDSDKDPLEQLVPDSTDDELATEESKSEQVTFTEVVDTSCDVGGEQPGDGSPPTVTEPLSDDSVSEGCVAQAVEITQVETKQEEKGLKRKLEDESETEEVPSSKEMKIGVEGDVTSQVRGVESEVTTQETESEVTSQEVESEVISQEVESEVTSQEVGREIITQELEGEVTTQEVESEVTTQEVKSEVTAQEVERLVTLQEEKNESEAETSTDKVEEEQVMVEAPECSQYQVTDVPPTQVCDSTTSPLGEMLVEPEPDLPMDVDETSVTSPMVQDDPVELMEDSEQGAS